MTNPLKNQQIILGVTGSIAAYKAADLASKLTQSGAQVDIVLTASALQFITPLTFQSVTARRAFTDADLWGPDGHVRHIAIGHAASLVVVAPASANTLAKLALGIADNLLSVSVLAASCPMVLAPAMDAGMFSHPATQKNVQLLRDRGATIIGPAEGHLASGLVGVGRMVEPSEVLAACRYVLSRPGPLKGRRVVVSAGGTQEPIDPVRHLTNRSSGRQGYALAQAALDAGADVTLITTPTHIAVPYGARVVPVRTAAEMLSAVLAETASADLLIMAAAVADFRPAQTAGQKIKKAGAPSSIPLEATADILAEVARCRAETGFPRRTIGFAAETQDLLANARAKLQAKRLDLIVANDVSAPDAGFEVSTNRVVLLSETGVEPVGLLPKEGVADLLIERVIPWFQ